MTVEMRHLRAFLAIAEERSLTRAAQRLHITQPALSRTLAQLERLLGVQLVDRSTHHVELTDTGRRFEQRAFEAVRAVETAVASASGRELPLRLGHNWSAGIHLASILRDWNAAPRTCELRFVRHDDRSAGLTSGTVDAALTRGPVDANRFRSVVVDREPRFAALPSTHPLARRKHLTLDQLSGEPLVASTAGVTTPNLWPSGHQPSVGTEVGSVDDWLVAIASGAGFGVTVASTAQLHQHPGIRYVRLHDAPAVPLLLAWPRQGFNHPAIGDLRRVALAAFPPTTAAQG
jgi:DNA-binding transcriptional LysR family regulator